jgi:hypothetical protein
MPCDQVECGIVSVDKLFSLTSAKPAELDLIVNHGAVWPHYLRVQ